MTEEQVKRDHETGETAMMVVLTTALIVLAAGLLVATMLRLNGGTIDAGLVLLGTIAVEIFCLMQAIFCRHWIAECRSYNLERILEEPNKNRASIPLHPSEEASTPA